MTKYYERDMKKLADTFAWAASADLKSVCQSIRTASLSPLRAVGSGGSLTTAYALTKLHQHYTNHLATVTTPLEAMDESLDVAVSTWLLTAGGTNVDILAVAKSLILREPRQLSVLCGRDTGALGGTLSSISVCRSYALSTSNRERRIPRD